MPSCEVYAAALLTSAATRDHATYTHGVPGAVPKYTDDDQRVYVEVIAKLAQQLLDDPRCSQISHSYDLAARQMAATWTAAKFHGTALSVTAGVEAMTIATAGLEGSSVAQLDDRVDTITAAELSILDAVSYKLL